MGVDAGVAPTASIVDDHVPVSAVVPSAAAAPTMLAGHGTCVWKPVRLNCSPDAKVDGVIVPDVVTSFRAMSPTGEPGQ